MGPVVFDLKSFEVDAVEREILQHPLVGGLILFSRNYDNIVQLKALIKEIRRIVKRPFLIAVDHEGGRVQRFIESFTKIPAMSDIEKCSGIDQSKKMAYNMGYVMAAELLACDIDLSFAPVLDLDLGSQVIGSRAFSSKPASAIILSREYINGMNDAGMKATGKHFPGHGSVLEDSHIAMPVDERSFDEITALDMSVFSTLIAENKLQAMMPAHVIYSQVDKHPAGFSSIWLQDILRKQLGFEGVIFSDDLSMQAATAISCVVDRSLAAVEAGCDMILVCNSPDEAIKVIDGLPISQFRNHADRAKSLLIDAELRHKTQSAAWQHLLVKYTEQLLNSY